MNLLFDKGRGLGLSGGGGKGRGVAGGGGGGGGGATNTRPRTIMPKHWKISERVVIVFDSFIAFFFFFSLLTQ